MISRDHRQELSEWIKARALELGFSACGIAEAAKLVREAESLQERIAKGYHGELAYMAQNTDKRNDPRLLFEGAKSVISVLLNYYPAEHLPVENNYRIARYAYGRDHHEEVRKRLNTLVKALKEEAGEINARIFIDSAPVFEKSWAYRAGLGYPGKNTLLINPKIGSFVFIGEIITDLELVYETQLVKDLCGKCTKCMDACPTGALVGPRELDARKCIAYLTIEYKGELPQSEREKFRDSIFGCDICQEVCPWNRKARPHNVDAFNPSEELRSMNKEKWQGLTLEEFQKMFKGSAVKRTKFDGLKRNIRFFEEK